MTRRSLYGEPMLRAIRDLLHVDGPGYALPDLFLQQLCELLHCDDIGFNHLDSTAETQYFSQGYAVDEGRWLIKGMPIPEQAEFWWANYWTSTCSFPERTGTYHHVQMDSDFLSRQQRKAHPLTAGHGPKMMLVLPDGGGRTLRLLVGREDEGPEMTEDDRFLLLLLLPHIERMYRTRARQRVGPTVRLTPRERQLVEQLRLGYTNAQIARRLHISEATVRTHLQHVYTRLGVTNRVAAVVRTEELSDVLSGAEPTMRL